MALSPTSKVISSQVTATVKLIKIKEKKKFKKQTNTSTIKQYTHTTTLNQRYYD